MRIRKLEKMKEKKKARIKGAKPSIAMLSVKVKTGSALQFYP
jgi:hypothetical protein